MNQRPLAALRAPKTIIVILRERFELHLHRKKDGRYVKTKYPIAVGKIGDRTKPGVYFVDAKTRRPAWTVPDHEDYRDRGTIGTTIPFEHPDNPFLGGFISISGGEGVGIHGTRFDPQLGTRASHGCIRMAEKDFLTLYRHTPLGTPVNIV